MSFARLSLSGRALRLLGQREHSRAELERKLTPHVAEGEDLAAVLDALEAKGFIDQGRVVDSVLHQRASRLGSARIRQELQAKGVDGAAIQGALEQLKDSELDRARALWARKFDSPASEPKEYAKQMRFLLARGFSAEVARRAMKSNIE